MQFPDQSEFVDWQLMALSEQHQGVFKYGEVMLPP
jgi:hypothetical protein